MIKVEGYQNLYRDELSGAIINTDSMAYNQYVNSLEQRDLQKKEISEIKNELDESEKLRIETKKLLEDSQSKLSSAVKESKKIIDQAKNDSEKMVSELELKFENSAKIKKELSLSKIKQMKDEAVREIKNTSVDVAFSASENLIKNSIEKSKLDNLFQKNLEDAKDALKKAGSN